MASDYEDQEIKAGVLITFGGIMLVVVLILGLTWIGQGNDFFLYKVFAPAQEAARRQTFKESAAYNDGMAQELRRMQMEYTLAKPEQKPGLRSIILHQYAEVDQNKLPTDLQTFLNQIKREQGGL